MTSPAYASRTVLQMEAKHFGQCLPIVLSCKRQRLGSLPTVPPALVCKHALRGCQGHHAARPRHLHLHALLKPACLGHNTVAEPS